MVMQRAHEEGCYLGFYPVIKFESSCHKNIYCRSFDSSRVSATLWISLHAMFVKIVPGIMKQDFYINQPVFLDITTTWPSEQSNASISSI